MDVKKNPGEHFAQAVPLAAVVNPTLHVHCPLDPHTPLRQLQLDAGLVTVAERHRPDPDIPSSQDAHPAGHAWQVGPKNPGEQDSHDAPVNPGAQLHVPEAEQTPEPAHGGEHADDSRSRSESAPELVVGSWVRSGIESQRMTRLLGPAFTAAHTLDDRAREPADNGWDAFTGGVEGSEAKAACPE